MNVRYTALAAALLVAVCGCGTEERASPAPSRTTTAAATTALGSLEAVRNDMAAQARAVIHVQAREGGFTASQFSAPRFPNELAVVMSAQTEGKGLPPQTMWFRVDFARSGDLVKALGYGKVGMEEAEVSFP